MKSEKLYFYIKALSIVGIALGVYLLWQQIARPEFTPCTINESINCDAIISGEVAKTFGIPTPLIGLVGYIIILISAFLKKKKLLLGMASFGLLFCLWIAYKELIELKVICPVCIACQIIMISVFSLSIYLFKESKDS